jgi:hypothetical protein
VKRGGGRPQAYRLEPTAEQKAAGKKGDRVPGVTTITGRFKEAGGLIHWAWQCGIDGIDYKAEKGAAADVGTMAHGKIDAYIHGLPAPIYTAPDEQIARADLAFDAFLEWATQVGLEVIETETALISVQHRYGGTFDALAKVAGRVVLLDWKSSKRVYSDYIVQLAAYRNLLRERGTSVDEAQLLHFGKEHGDFHHHHYPAPLLDKAWTAFLRMRELYDLDKELEGAAA